MKKTSLVLALILLTALLAGCQGQQAPTRTPTELAQQYELVKQDSSPAAQVPAATQALAQATSGGTSPVPLQNPPHMDLSDMSYTMAYAQVYSMVMAPKRHQGETLKIQGSYYGFQSEGGQDVHLILIIDDAGCCEVGMEFQLTGTHTWPEDYPANNSIIRLTGLMDVIYHGDNPFPLLVANEIEVIKEAAPR